MAYSIVSNITSLDSAVQEIINFAVTQAGFTNAGTFVAEGSYTGRILSRTRDSLTTYWYFYARPSAVNPGGFTGAHIISRMQSVLPTAANFTDVSVGQAIRTEITTFYNDGAVTYPNLYMFTGTTNDAVIAVLEVQPGQYTHIEFGNIKKSYVFVGGEFISGLAARWAGSQYESPGTNTNRTRFPFSDHQIGAGTTTATPNVIRYNDGTGTGGDDEFPFFNDNSNSGSSYTACGTIPGWAGSLEPLLSNSVFRWNLYGFPLSYSPSNFNLRAPIFPIIIGLKNNTDINLNWIAGYVEDVGVINIQSFDAAGIVDTDWQVFPIGQKFGSNAVCLVNNAIGLAIRRIGPEV